MIFKPRQVPPSNLKFWFVEALALSRRRLFHFIALSIALYVVISIEAGQVTMLLPPILFPVILALGCAIAKSGDESVPFIEVVTSVGFAGWLRVATAAAIPWTTFLVLWVFSGAFSDGPSVDLNIQMQHELRQAGSDFSWRSLTMIGFLAIITPVIIYFFFRFTCLVWFLWSLCAIADLPLVEALEQAYEGVSINKFVIWPYAIATVLLFALPMLLGIWAVYPWLAITCSMLYTSYRDVWLSRSKNYPVPSLVVSMQQSAS